MAHQSMSWELQAMSIYEQVVYVNEIIIILYAGNCLITNILFLLHYHKIHTRINKISDFLMFQWHE